MRHAYAVSCSTYLPQPQAQTMTAWGTAFAGSPQFGFRARQAKLQAHAADAHPASQIQTTALPRAITCRFSWTGPNQRICRGLIGYEGPCLVAPHGFCRFFGWCMSKSLSATAGPAQSDLHDLAVQLDESICESMHPPS